MKIPSSGALAIVLSLSLSFNVEGALLDEMDPGKGRPWLSWCGKHYEPGSPVVPPLGATRKPTISPIPLLDFRAIPTQQPYLPHLESQGSLLLTLLPSYTHGSPYPSTSPAISPPSSLLLEQQQAQQPFTTSPIFFITCSATHPTLSNPIQLFPHPITLPFPSTLHEIPFNLYLLPSSLEEPYYVSCEARSHNSPTFTSSPEILHILPPNPWGGSTVKMDRRTGGILVPTTRLDSAMWEPLIPVGFYTSYEGYLDDGKEGLKRLGDMKEAGFNVVHPVPTFGDSDTLKRVLDRARDLGLWLIYDMRHSFTSLPSVLEQVALIRTYPNLLTFYTADEPDGNESPLSSPLLAYQAIKSSKGDAGYHPVSLVLNCGDYYFEEYTRGADIVLMDAYPFNVNGTFSNVWSTPCNETYGCCGCDNCFTSSVLDVSNRLVAYDGYRATLGRERNLTFWAVPQAFGREAYWREVPSGEEVLLSSVLSLIHGALAITPWIAPTTPSIFTHLSRLSQVLSSTLTPLILHPHAVKTIVIDADVHYTVWRIRSEGGKTGKWLVMLANLGQEGREVRVELAGWEGVGEGREVLNGKGELGLEVGKGWVKGWVGEGGVGGWVVE